MCIYILCLLVPPPLNFQGPTSPGAISPLVPFLFFFFSNERTCQNTQLELQETLTGWAVGPAAREMKEKAPPRLYTAAPALFIYIHHGKQAGSGFEYVK